MIRAIILSAFLFLAVGCGDGLTTHNQLPELAPYFEAFVAEAEVRGIGVPAINIEFTDDKNAPAGKCVWSPFVTSTIKINQNTWSHLTEVAREMIMFHELGHCALGRDHVDGDEPTLMRPYPLEIWKQYEQSPKRYIDELFEN